MSEGVKEHEQLLSQSLEKEKVVTQVETRWSFLFLDPLAEKTTTENTLSMTASDMHSEKIHHNSLNGLSCLEVVFKEER